MDNASAQPSKTAGVFLSYAREDTDAARRIAKALRSQGVEVWFDQDELRGGDAWDQKIREQVETCALFVPFISAHTQVRRESYFRLEWNLADERTHLMAHGTPFIVPVVIDDTKDRGALVPKSFLAVQWTRLPDGAMTEGFVERVKKLLLGEDVRRALQPVVAENTAWKARTTKNRAPWLVPTLLGFAASVAIALWQPWTKAPPEQAVAGTKSSAPVASTTPRLGAKTGTTLPDKSAAMDKSVAVLAFKNLSGDPTREFFSDGMSEAVTDVLGRVPGLKVVGSASAFSFKGKSEPIPEIARQLGVTHLVEGTVLQEGQTVRITAKLIKADGFQVWISDKLERELKNIFALHDEVAGLIAKNLSLRLGASSATAKDAVNPQAFELYAQARQAWHLRTEKGFDLAETALTRALAVEPNFARAHAALADVWAQRLWHSRERRLADAQAGAPERARISAKITQALMLDPDSAEAHASLGALLSHDGSNAEAESALRRAVALNPNFSLARWWLGWVLLNRAHIDEALEHLKLATELDPLAPTIWVFYGWGLRYAGRYAEAVFAADRALALNPNNRMMVLWDKVANLVALGRDAEAVELVRPLSSDSPLVAAIQLHAFAGAGLTSEVEELLAKPRSEIRWAGGLLALLERTEEALALIIARAQEAYFAADYLWDPLYDPVRTDSRWVKLMADAGLTDAHARAQAWRAAHPPEKPAVKK